MKILLKYLFIAFLITLGSCEYLDYNQEDFYTEDMVFENFERTKNFLNNTYNLLPDGFNEIGGAMRSSASDDAVEANNLSAIHIMTDGRWNAAQTVDEKWLSMYNGIRSANRILKNYDVSVLDERRYNDNYVEMIKQYKSFDDQARFLRAYFYFELLRRYGGVPLLEGKVLTLEEVNEVQHNSFEEVKSFIVEECNAVKDSLPINYLSFPGEPNKGRATCGAAMALKARTLLYAASPLHNPDNDISKWEQAAEAAYALIDSAQNYGWYALQPNYSEVFNNSESYEMIFGRRFGASNSFERSNFPVGYEGADPGTCPTQNLVDTYEMINGKDIDEQDSNYDPDNPYQNRDSRLSETIIVNNSTWKERNVEIWNGGLDGLPIEKASKTGYYLKKYVDENASMDPDNPIRVNHLWVFLRYAEVLLNYAEAMNEAYGPDDPYNYSLTAVDAMNMIRARAGLPGYDGAMTKEAVRKEIREERRVELAFENHRFWDIRRWKIGNETSQIKGMTITINEDSTFNYQEKVVENRTWDPKMNLYPIPQNEIFKNSNLNQNEGW